MFGLTSEDCAFKPWGLFPLGALATHESESLLMHGIEVWTDDSRLCFEAVGLSLDGAPARDGC